MSTDEKRKLTANDPVDSETLEKLRELENLKDQIGHRLLHIEDEKVQILVTFKTIKYESQKLFERVIGERGIPAERVTEINLITGQIVLDRPLPQEPEQKA